MAYRFAANAVLTAHLAFVLFVVCGGVLVLRRPRVAWLHLPAVAWATFVEFSGRVCPLTPLEVALRQGAGEAGYRGDFVEHYLVALIYPDGLTRALQMTIGSVVLLINIVVYLLSWRRGRA